VPETSSNLAALVSGTARSRVLVTDTDVKLFKALSVNDAYRPSRSVQPPGSVKINSAMSKSGWQAKEADLSIAYLSYIFDLR
jgi:hypothetical protein